MDNWVRWTADEKETLIKLKKMGKTHEQISDVINKSVSSISSCVKRMIEKGVIEAKPRKKREGILSGFISEEEELKRQAAYATGESDKVCARMCGINGDTFGSWRRSRMLPRLFEMNRGNKPGPKVVYPDQRRVFTADDVKYYKCNTYKPNINTPGPIIIRVDKEEAEARCKALGIDKPTGELNHHPTVPSLGGELLGLNHGSIKLRRPATPDTYRIGRSQHG